MKPQLIEHLKTVGETDALEGDDWQTYPKSSLSDNPNSELLYQDHPWALPIQEISGYQK